ncbi:MAG TPA: hypothetical protein PLB59_09740 [Bacteroidales bacterium]|jgi:hypothetical protein|nr:hypothetical protein [Bacteroidales bacterium]HQN16672.1 hypothetical protein [Bacteroidales bacterium]HQP16239.1 hypothetical protein [Bacteroidales bacterium]
MKQARIIYDTNRQAINDILFRRGYPKTFDGFINAFENLGDPFLVEVYNDITSMYSSAEGNFWSKFRNIFHKATGIAGGVDTMINRDKQEPSNTPSSDDDKDEKKKNKLLLYCGLGALAIIIMLIIIYIFKK